MRISKITKHKKYNYRYHIFTDESGGDTYQLTIHEDILIRFSLRKGMEITENELNTIKREEAIYRFYTMAINYLSYRMRSKGEMIRYLKEKEATDDEVKIIIDKLIEEKLLDDLQFSFAFVRSKLNTTSSGPLKIKNDLLQKGVSPSIIDEALSAYPLEEEIKKAAKMIEKKMASNRRKSFKEQKMLLKQSLMQKGFSQEAIDLAFNEVDVEVEEESEYESLRYQGEKAWTKYSRKHEGYSLKQKVKASLYQKGFTMDLINRFIDEKEAEVESIE